MSGWLAAAALLLAAAPRQDAEPLGFHNGRLFIAAKVNGVVTEALLDSGAEATLVDPELAAKAKLPEGTPQIMKGSGGTAQARIVEGVTVEALGKELHPEAVVVLDMTDLSNRLIKRPTHAIVGRELFDAARLEIDIARGEIAVVDKAVPPRGKQLALTEHAGDRVRRRVVQTVLRRRPRSILAMAARSLISRALARRLKLKTIGTKTGGGIGGEISRDIVRLNSLEVAGAPVPQCSQRRSTISR